MVFVGVLLIIPVIMDNSIFVNAQQQSPQKDAPEKGTVFVFNEKSRPANEPEKCAALASVVKGKQYLIITYVIL